MTTRLWIGGHGNNQANNANNWLGYNGSDYVLKGAPQPGDNLYTNVPAGGSVPVMNLTGNALQGDVLSVEGENLTLNMTNATATIGDSMIESATGGNAITVNVSGVDTLDTFQGAEWPGNAPININETPKTILTGTFILGSNNNEPNSLTLTGQRGSTFHNLNSIAGSPGLMFINADVSGAGDFDINGASFGGDLEFGKSVGADQVVRVSANTEGGLLRVDQPTQFLGQTELFDRGEIDLEGLANASSYTFQNDLLSIYAGNTVIDTLRLHDSTTYGFEVEQATSGVNVIAYADASHTPVGTPLPMHA